MKTLGELKEQNEELHSMLEAIVDKIDAKAAKPSPQPRKVVKSYQPEQEDKPQ